MVDRLESLNQVFPEQDSAGLNSTTARGQHRLVALAAALGLALLAWRPLRRDRWSFGDIEHLWFPLRYEYSRCLKFGYSLLWSPSLFCGTYLHGEGQFGLFHPATQLLYRVVPFPASFDIESWIRYPLLVLGMYVLLRRWRLPRVAALAGGAVLLGGTSLNSYGFQHFLQILAHIPWQLVCIDVFLRDRDPRRRALAWLGLCVLTGSHLLLGYYQISLMAALTGLVYAFAITGPRIRPLALFAISQVFGLLVAGLQWLPVLDVLQTSYRADTPWSERMLGSLHPYNFIQIVLPYTFREWHHTTDPQLKRNIAELDVYNGLFTVLLATWAVSRFRRLSSLRPIIVAGVALVVLGWVIALGKYGGLYPLMAKLPLIGSFRFPSRYRLISQIGLAMLTAIGVTDLIACRDCGETAIPRGVRILALVAALAGGCALAVALVSDHYAPHFSITGIVVSLTMFAAGFLLLVAASKGMPGAVELLLFLVVLEPMVKPWLNYESRHRQAKVEDLRFSAFNPPPNPIGHRVQFSHVPTPDEPISVRVTDTPLLKDLRLFDGLVGLFPMRPFLSEEAITPFMRIGSVSWRYRADSEIGSWVPIHDPMPLVRLVARAQVIKDLSADLLAIDPRETALVNFPIALTPGPRGDARLIDYRPGRIVVETNSNFERLLVISERGSRGWRVYREEIVEKPIAVYGDFMGVIVPPGRHEVVFQFQPKSFTIGAWITAAALTILVGFGIVVLCRYPRYLYEKLMRLFANDFDPVEYGETGQLGISG
jgi:hypothetical protein